MKNTLRSLYILVFKSQNACLQDYLNFQAVIDVFARKKKAVNYYNQIEHAREAMKNKTRFLINVQKLSEHPSQSLGFELYKHICELGDGYDEFPDLNTATDYDYINTHMFESHDVWHTVLGLKTTVRDEIYLQAFMAAQTPGYLSNLMCMAHLLGILFFKPTKLISRSRSVYRYYLCGKQAKPLFGVNWNHFLETNLLTLRQDLRISI